jgi:hypothetical protein
MTEGFIRVNPDQPENKDLDTTIVTQTDGRKVHREVVVNASPTIFGAYQETELISKAARVILYDAAGNPWSSTNPTPTWLYTPTGTALGSKTIHGQEALLVTDAPHSDDVFFGFGEQGISGVQSNYDITGIPAQTQPEPDTAGYTLYIVSDSASDTAAGIGAQSMMVHYLDTAGVQQTVTVATNGQTEVNTGVTDCMFVQDSHLIAFGTTSVGVGNVDCLAGSGGAIVQRIEAGSNQSMSTMRQVPAGFTLVVKRWRAFGTAATTKIANLRLRSTGHEAGNLPGVYHFRDSARLKDGSTGDLPIQFEVPELGTIKISAWTTGTMGLTARWQGYLEPVV